MILSRFGWGMLIVILLVIGLFAATVRVQRGPAGPVPGATEPAETATLRRGAIGAPVLRMPVAGVPRGALVSNWGDPREAGARVHHGLDILAPQGARVLAATPGTIEKLYYSHGGGGITIYERSADGRWMYYYAHLAGYAKGLQEGQQVTAGQTIAFVGDTGNAGAGNYHLHFGVSHMARGDGWWEGQPIDPYPLLACAGAAR